MILLTTTGRKTGKPRTWPLTGLRTGAGWAVAGSNGGHDHHPAWYLNLVANPDANVTEGRRTVPVRARIAESAERDEQYQRFVDYLPGYADYAAATTRTIPVVFLEPTDSIACRIGTSAASGSSRASGHEVRDRKIFA